MSGGPATLSSQVECFYIQYVFKLFYPLVYNVYNCASLIHGEGICSIVLK